MPRGPQLTSKQREDSVYFSLRLSKRQHRWLVRRAFKSDMHMRQLISSMIERAIDEEKTNRGEKQ